MAEMGTQLIKNREAVGVDVTPVTHAAARNEQLSNLVYDQFESGGDFLLFFLGFTRLIGNRYSILKPDPFDHVG